MNRFLQSMMLGAGLALAAPATVAAADVYIIGSNVNGNQWTLAAPDALMEETSPGVYEWDGEVLGSSFKFNDGTWDDGTFEGTDISNNLGSNGDSLEIGVPYYFQEWGSDIAFAGLQEVKNPHVVLDFNDRTVLVTGEGVATPEHPDLYLIGSFTDWAFVENMKFSYSEEDNLYTLTGVTIADPEAEFKISSERWQYQLGAFGYGDPIVEGEEYFLSTANTSNITGDLYGIYDVTLNPEVPSVLFEKVGELAPPAIDYSLFKFQLENGSERTLYDLQPTDTENVYKLVVDIYSGNRFVLINNDKGQYYVSKSSSVLVKEGTLNCTLYRWTPEDEWYPYYTTFASNGVYEITFTFSEEKVELNLEKLEDLDPLPIEYDNFVFRWYNHYGNMNSLPLTPTEESNVFTVNGIDLTANSVFGLFYDGRDEYFISDGSVEITSNNLSCTLSYWNGAQDWSPEYAFSKVSGKFNLTITFDGETAKLEFTKVQNLTFNPMMVEMYRYTFSNEQYAWIKPTSGEGNTVEYKNQAFYEPTGIVFADTLFDTVYGGSIEEDEVGNVYFGNVISPDNLSTTVAAGSLTYVYVDLKGKYDITVEFNEDRSEATVTFSKAALPEVVTNYEGDLYIAGNVNGWGLADPDYKMTCVEPGIYEWSGETLTSGFKFNSGEWMTPFPGTDLPINFGGYRQYSEYLNLDIPYEIEIDGSDIRFGDSSMVVKNPKVTLNLHDMTILVTGEVEEPAVEFDPYDMRLVFVGDEDEDDYLVYADEMLDSHTVLYRNVRFPEFVNILFVDYNDNIFFAAGNRENVSINPERLTTEVVLNPEEGSCVAVTGLNDGYYDVTLAYSEDFRSAIVTFAKSGAAEYGVYEGDLYICGAGNGWELADPAYKMTCVEPGIYEWSGDELKTEFKINGGDWDAKIPGTDLRLVFGGEYQDLLKIGVPYQVLVRAYNIFFEKYTEVKNVKVTLNLKDMTLLVDGDVEKPEVNIEDAVLFTYDGDEYYAKTTENGIMYEGVRIDGVTQLAISLDGVYYGWESVAEDNIPWVTEESPETVIYSSTALGTYPYYVLAYLEGIYTVYVEFNEDLTTATMRFEKSGEIYAYLNVTIENGTSFSVRSLFGASEYIRVTTNDPFWGLTGYETDGEVYNYEYPLTEVKGNVYLPEEGNLDLLFFTEYLGECKVIEGTTGMVEFDNAVTITRIADGVEIRNVEVGTDIAVYTLGGQVVMLFKATDPEMTVHLEKGQTFIVRVGNVAAKVLM